MRPGAIGASCSLARDCQSGVCEGQGCGANAGKCVASRRACTKDLRVYCGCDGKTFRGSGSCPGRVFAHRGECRAVPGKKALGAKCSTADECQSGQCEGQGCGANMGTCTSRKRPCTMDLRAYCGCDGKTFRASGTCPGARFSYRGECKPSKKADGAKCNSAAECQSGTCEGKGCGPNMGICAPQRRACTRDRRAFCGCDGKTFFSSSRCPGQRFSHSGKCSTKTADGGACTVAGDCMSGICEGVGCGTKTGKCASKRRACTKDYRAYCGCDGKTFHGSGSCPGQRFSKRGECSTTKAADGASCYAAGDCASGVCEGMGCGRSAGKCVSKMRRCTTDLVQYCGCDGKTFSGSSTCPGRRYAARKACARTR